MNHETHLTIQDRDVLDLIDQASSQYEKYVELRSLILLCDLFNEQTVSTVHNWSNPLGLVWVQD